MALKNFLVTGGAGFIGSNLVKELIKDSNNNIFVFDNLSTGRSSNLLIDNKRCKFFQIDLKTSFMEWPEINNLDTIFHFAANADVRGGEKNREIDFIENVIVTKSICDYASIMKVKKVAFASSATVYGEPEIFPTPEASINLQTSVYGASKLAGEAYLQAYAEYKDFKVTIFRFVSWIGTGYSHGVIYDFVKKLLSNPKELLILGDGKQRKSYLSVEDGVNGVILLNELNQKKCSIFNLGHSEIIDVDSLASIICKRMNLSNVNYIYSGGKRGWTGDSPLVHLDISNAKKYGWSPKINIEKAICNTVDFLLKDSKNLYR